MTLDKNNKSEKAVFDFWDRWWNASEIEKTEILKELTFDAYLKKLNEETERAEAEYNRRLEEIGNKQIGIVAMKKRLKDSPWAHRAEKDTKEQRGNHEAFN